jgi:hypothetical protein
MDVMSGEVHNKAVLMEQVLDQVKATNEGVAALTAKVNSLPSI